MKVEAGVADVGVDVHYHFSRVAFVNGQGRAVCRERLGRCPLVQWLISVPGFGLILAHVVAAEVGRLERFRSAKAASASLPLAVL